MVQSKTRLLFESLDANDDGIGLEELKVRGPAGIFLQCRMLD
jgi:hypothetical protein